MAHCVRVCASLQQELRSIAVYALERLTYLIGDNNETLVEWIKRRQGEKTLGAKITRKSGIVLILGSMRFHEGFS